MNSHNRISGLQPVTNEKGSIIVIALLMVMVLSIIVIGGSRTSSMDVKITTNKKSNERNLYIAEGLIAQSAKILENTKLTDPDGLRFKSNAAWPPALVTEVSLNGVATPVAAVNWTGYQAYDWVSPVPSVGWPNFAAWQNLNPRAATDQFEYVMISEGVVGGGSLDMANTRMYQFNLRGRVRSGNGNSEITMGYRIRY